MRTDEDLQTVTKDVVNDYKAERRMKLRKSYIQQRSTRNLGFGAMSPKDMLMKQSVTVKFH